MKKHPDFGGPNIPLESRLQHQPNLQGSPQFLLTCQCDIVAHCRDSAPCHTNEIFDFEVGAHDEIPLGTVPQQAREDSGGRSGCAAAALSSCVSVATKGGGDAEGGCSLSG